jgi:hypothetical protein
MTDRYVIVYRDGRHGLEMCRSASDIWLARAHFEHRRPAYRIRIREKPQTIPALGMTADEAVRRGHQKALLHYYACIDDGAYS